MPPSLHAQWSGVVPSEARVSTSAPAAKSKPIIGTSSMEAAECRAVRPRLLAAFGLARPFSSISLTCARTSWLNPLHVP